MVKLNKLNFFFYIFKIYNVYNNDHNKVIYNIKNINIESIFIIL